MIGLLFGIALSLLLATFAGENAWHVFSVMTKSAVGSQYDLGLTLFHTTSLVFTGLSVAVAFHAGLFNIGAEGQLLVGAMGISAIALKFPNLPAGIAPLLAGIFGVLMAACWGGVAGLLRGYRGSHEVVITMMMNFIASGITSYMTLSLFRSTQSQNPETEVVQNQFLFKDWDFISRLLTDSPANFSIVLAILISVCVYFILFKTRWGFDLRALGANPTAAQYSGIHPARMMFLAMFFAGALSGFVGINEILGNSGKFRIGFSPEYGFVGIAVALLANNNPLAILASAFLFGALQKGAADLDMETAHITRDFARIMQAIVIFSVIAASQIDFKKMLNKLRGSR